MEWIFKWIFKLDCDLYFPGNGCKTPLIPGHYMAPYQDYDDNLEIPVLPLFPKLLEDLDGKCKARIRLIAEDGRYLCWEWAADIIVQP